MDTTIFYYTGTGNSLWVARTLAHEMEGARVLPISGCDEREASKSKTIGLIFPVHIWGVPTPVVRFVEKLRGLRPEYVFGIAVHAGQVSNTLVQLNRVMAGEGMLLSAGFEIRMPSNYIPWGGPGPLEKQHELFTLAQEKILRIVDGIQKMIPMGIERGPLWQRIIFTPIYTLSLSHVPEMDKKFWADDRCNACGICRDVCPASNISLYEGRPLWHHRCEQCFACLQWCPQEAIQYGKRTPGYERYQHPEVLLADMVKKVTDGS